MKKKIFLIMIFFKLIFGEWTGYNSLFHNHIELLDISSKIKEKTYFDNSPFQNKLCFTNDVLNKTIIEYRKEYTKFYNYIERSMCETIENYFI